MDVRNHCLPGTLTVLIRRPENEGQTPGQSCSPRLESWTNVRRGLRVKSSEARVARRSKTCRSPLHGSTLPEFPAARTDDKLGLARILRATRPQQRQQQKNHLKTRLLTTDLDLWTLDATAYICSS